MSINLHFNFCVHSKRETCLKTDSRVFSEEISLKQGNLSSKSPCLYHTALVDMYMAF